MQTEDSHPHEVLSGNTSYFPFWPSEKAGYVDVKCTLTGHGVAFQLVFSGITPNGWAADNKEAVLGPGELQIDIVGTIKEAGKPNVFFAFENKSSTGLLWHQCYNN